MSFCVKYKEKYADIYMNTYYNYYRNVLLIDIFPQSIRRVGQ